jgi:hypothetical protein
MSTAKAAGSGTGIKVTAKVPGQALPFMAARLDQSMPVGNEGAGTVIAAGSSEAAQALLGKTVSMVGGAMYSQYRCLKAADSACRCPPARRGRRRLVVRQSADRARHGRDDAREGHKALVHTAAASNLGPDAEQDLHQGRHRPGQHRAQARAGQAAARHRRQARRATSSSPSFMDDLTQALVETGATIAFDAIGGGKLASQILTAWRSRRTRPPRNTAATARPCTSRSTSTAASTPARPSSRATSAWRGASAAGC